MNRYYEQVDGWCDYEEFYRDMAHRLPINGTFVEIGVWAGRSLIYFLSCLQDIGKEANVFAVDTWEGSVLEPRQKEFIRDKFNNDIYGHFLQNLKNAGFIDKVIVLKMPSIVASESFADNSIDFCYIDASHTYEEINQDINAWNPKVCDIIAGHDIDHVPVNRAVKEHFPNFQRADGHVWYLEKERKSR